MEGFKQFINKILGAAAHCGCDKCQGHPYAIPIGVQCEELVYAYHGSSVKKEEVILKLQMGKPTF
jgi:hypothetical protein